MNLSYSLIVGMVATVNPCGFVLLPTYLMYFLGISSSEAGRQRASITRALLVSGAVSAGFMLVFLIVGAITRFFTDRVTANAKYVFIAQQVENEGGGLSDAETWPPKGQRWWGVSSTPSVSRWTAKVRLIPLRCARSNASHRRSLCANPSNRPCKRVSKRWTP